jgi:hypothetical protein
MLQQLWEIFPSLEDLQNGLQDCLYTVVSPDTLFPTPSLSSAMKTPDSESPDPSASLVESEQTQKTRKGNSVAPEPAPEGDIYWDTPLVTSAALTVEQ